MHTHQTMRVALAALLGVALALPLAAQEPPAVTTPTPTPTLQEEDQTMYLNENFMPSNERRATYALRTPPVRDEALGAWHVRLEFPDKPGVLAFETYATDLDLKQVRFVRFRKYYYENGQLLRETYLNAQGEELLGGCVYYENGQVKQRVTALPNGRDSISETYHENGQLAYKNLYHDDEMADGEEVSYGANGAVSSRSYRRNGKTDGVQESFYPDGKLHRRGQFVNGKQEGEFVRYAQDGSVLARTVWVHDQPDGWSFESHDNGVVSNKTLYRKGAVLSLQTWAPDGRPKFAWQKDAQGREHGDTTDWHANGVRASVTSFVRGKRHGLLQTWYSDGTLQQIVPYEHGKKHGVERQWSKDGKLLLEQMWQAGQPVSAS